MQYRISSFCTCLGCCCTPPQQKQSCRPPVHRTVPPPASPAQKPSASAFHRAHRQICRTSLWRSSPPARPWRQLCPWCGQYQATRLPISPISCACLTTTRQRKPKVSGRALTKSDSSPRYAFAIFAKESITRTFSSSFNS